MTICTSMKQDIPTFCHEVKKVLSPIHHEDRMEKALRLAEKLSAVALGVLAAHACFWLFLPSFAAGIIIGVYTSQNTSSRHHHHPEGTCSHAFIEQTTGVKLPDSLALLAGFAVTAVHIDHHASVFVPIVGLTLGIWAGNLSAPKLSHCMRKFNEFVSKS